jgi:hypothetical protein
VLEDYARMMSDALAASEEVLEVSLQALCVATAPVHLQQTGSGNTVIVYNPLARARDEIVAVQLPPPPSFSSSPPSATDVWPAILDCKGQPVIAQASTSPSANRTVYFRAQIPSLGHALYFIDYTLNTTVVQPQPSPPPPLISNAALEIAFDSLGNMQSVVRKSDGVRAQLQQQLMRYTTTSGGPYCLVEQAPASPLPAPSRVSAVTGPVFSEVRWEWQDGAVEQVLRLGSADDDTFSMTNVINTIEKGTEMVWRLTSDLASAGDLHTDDSGLEMHARAHEPTLALAGRWACYIFRAALLIRKLFL